MKFVIDTTYSTRDIPPCDGATEYIYPKTFSRRIFDENGQPITMERTVAEKCWVIEINSLEELIQLNKTLKDKAGDQHIFEGLILRPYPHETGLPEIEIYDSYRE